MSVTHLLRALEKWTGGVDKTPLLAPNWGFRGIHFPGALVQKIVLCVCLHLTTFVLQIFRLEHKRHIVRVILNGTRPRLAGAA